MAKGWVFLDVNVHTTSPMGASLLAKGCTGSPRGMIQIGIAEVDAASAIFR